MSQAIHDVYCGIMADHQHPTTRTGTRRANSSRRWRPTPPDDRDRHAPGPVPGRWPAKRDASLLDLEATIGACRRRLQELGERPGGDRAEPGRFVPDMREPPRQLVGRARGRRTDRADRVAGVQAPEAPFAVDRVGATLGLMVLGAHRAVVALGILRRGRPRRPRRGSTISPQLVTRIPAASRPAADARGAYREDGAVPDPGRRRLDDHQRFPIAATPVRRLARGPMVGRMPSRPPHLDRPGDYSALAPLTRPAPDSRVGPIAVGSGYLRHPTPAGARDMTDQSATDPEHEIALRLLEPDEQVHRITRAQDATVLITDRRIAIARGERVAMDIPFERLRRISSMSSDVDRRPWSSSPSYRVTNHRFSPSSRSATKRSRTRSSSSDSVWPLWTDARATACSAGLSLDVGRQGTR